jgi:hypothetical protein
VDPETGELPPPGSFTNPDDYEAQVSEAEAIIEARNNPVYYYFTQPTDYNYNNYKTGDEYVSTEVGHPAPPNTTLLTPPANPSPASAAILYWSGTEFVWLTYPEGSTLQEAQQFTVNATNTTAYGILQPTDWYVVRRSDVGTPIPENIDSWRQEIRNEAQQKNSTIVSLETLESVNDYTMSDEYLSWAPEPQV